MYIFVHWAWRLGWFFFSAMALDIGYTRRYAVLYAKNDSKLGFYITFACAYMYIWDIWLADSGYVGYMGMYALIAVDI